ncbi:MAG: hypothetical protein BGO63_05305 [Candidatus Accumulibacter sp. 66-26]|mgnify:FL=1|nr:SPASM domain-containing protein [Accumulibacter sp.]OJW50438.1 MAG: hypothetical protein BGO63_05305 [Candidatus Accumulibacter sp. 66-26]
MLEDLRNLYLLVAGDCNLACAYCYAEGGSFGGGPRAMSPETLRTALDKLVPEDSALVVSFFGGEPLLEFELLRQAVAWGNALGAERGTRLRYVLTTNGTLLDDDRLSFLKAHVSHVAVSLDGGQALTDASRCFKDYEGSVYRVVVQNLERLKREGIPFGLRGTIPAGRADELDAAVAYLQSLGPVSVRVEAAAGAEPWPREHWHAWTEAVIRSNKRALERLMTGKEPGPAADIYRVAAHRLNGLVRQYPCVAGQGILAVSTGGDVYPCDHFIGDPAFCMGNVRQDDFPGEAYCRIVNLLQANRVDDRPKCANCRVRYLCGGECPARSLSCQGNIADPSPSHCVHTRRVLRRAERLVDTVLADPIGRERLAASVQRT